MFAVLHVTDFRLQAVLRLEPAGGDRPVALIDETRRPPVVLACTARAEAAGVTRGQTAPQAMARCAAVRLLPRQPAAEAEARAALVAAALTVAPQLEDTVPGVITLAVAGLERRRRRPALVRAIGALAELGLTVTAGLAATPLLALYAARHPRRRALAAGVAEDRTEERNGSQPAAEACTAIEPGEERAFLRELPLAVAEPAVSIAPILEAWGIRTLGELTALTKADVTQRLGPDGLALWERAAGEATRPLQWSSVAPVFVAEFALEHEVETLEPLLFILRRLIDRLALELRTAMRVAGTMTLGLRLSDETEHVREFRLPEPTAREELLFRVLHTHLETLHTAATVRGLRLSCGPVRPLVRQQGLFETGLRDPHGFAETLARVAAVVGPERVGVPVVENTHRPDAVKTGTPAMVVPEAKEESGVVRRGPPLRRYRPPLRATVELQGSGPTFVWTASMAGAVLRRAGPWCVSGDWWDVRRAWGRQEWDVELETGGVFRLVHTEEGWWVEGEYD